MRTLLVALLFLAQAQTYPPPYPRPGTTKVMENDLVIVWDVSWLKQAYPTHRHVYDYAGVYYTDGDRIIVSEQGARRPQHSVAWDTFSLKVGVTHSEEGASDEPLRGIFLEFKQPKPTGTIDTRTSPAAFPGTSGKQLQDDERVTIRELTPAAAPSSSPHVHTRDNVIVTFTALKPHVTFVNRGTTDSDNHTAGADRALVFEVK